MSTIVTRAGKGSALTWTEGDSNFTNLNTDKMESFIAAGDSGTSQTISGGNTLTIAGGTNLNSVASATDTITVNLDTTVTGLTSLASTTLITETIQSTGGSPIIIAPDGTGDVHLNADSVRIGDNNADATIVTRGTGDLILTTNEGSGTEGVIRIYDGANGNIELVPNGTGDINLSADTINVGDLDTAATITTNGLGNLVLSTNAGTNSGTITINQGTNANIQIAPNGTGLTVINGPTVGIVTSTAGSSPFTGRHTATASSSQANLSMNVQKHRTDILLAAMTAEPSVIGFSVRDSSSTNRIFARLNATYQGTGSTPYFQLQTSTDGFSTSAQTALLGGGVGVWGATGNGYTHTTNGAGNLTLSTNSGTSSGTIVITQGADANITITPNGVGDTVITNLAYNEAVYTAGTTTGTITPNAGVAPIQSITLTGSITLNAFTTPISGQTLTLIITQPASGGPYTLTSTMLFAGGSKTLSTAANAVDILTVSYIGTTYYASLAKAFA